MNVLFHSTKITLLLFLAFSTLVFAQNFRIARVVDATDVSSLNLKDGSVIHYAALVFPSDNSLKQTALENLKSFVDGKYVRLEFEKDISDNNGKSLAYVFSDKLFINAWLLENGCATLSPDINSSKYRDVLLAAENKARIARKGVWRKKSGSVLPEIKSSPSTTGIDAATDFRNCKWGDSVADVKKKETAATLQGPSYAQSLLYDAQIAGMDSYAFYGFTKASGRLVRGGYMIVAEHSDKNRYIVDYNKIIQLLTKTYGEPTKSGTHWTDESFKAMPRYHGTAIAAGHMRMEAIWELERTMIVAVIRGDKLKMHFGVIYQTRVLDLLAELKKEEAAEIVDGM
jgi:hypothetical protein